MKTKINITNYLTKGFILALIAVSLMINTSAQKTQDSVNSEKFASAQIIASELAGDNTKKMNSAAASKSVTSEMSIEAFLIKAAGLNAVISLDETEVSSVIENNDLEQFLISAAGLYQTACCNSDENVTPSVNELENFLIHAASLDAVQDIDAVSADSDTESQDAGLIDFLMNAAGLNMLNSSTMN